MDRDQDLCHVEVKAHLNHYKQVHRRLQKINFRRFNDDVSHQHTLASVLQIFRFQFLSKFWLSKSVVALREPLPLQQPY